ncbi:hypothetical protein EH183_43450 [Streptomyces sp. CB01881]|uniref:hypothetical protein n=1 Tax=Streptomyces sp. CB01881 TaxID=2078691 RepID=UPI0011DF5CFF|nr:hypothetical protein [Streptomyces sp. CB01881]TYC66251.1 hypothetical protein EH183_43450 [Streptomyces sp. CB01881]
MNHHQLLAALREAGVSDSSYGIMVSDLPRSKYIQETIPVLVEKADGRWTIEAWERGQHWTEASFDTETDACAYLYAYLVNQ